MTDLNHINEQLRPLAIAIDSLNIDPKNARKHDDKNTEATRKSMVKWGQRLPFVVQKQGMIVRVGNNRTAIAREMGWTHVAAIVVDESDVEAAAFAVSENRTGELAEWDFPALQAVVKELNALPSFDISDLGFEAFELDPLLEGSWEPPDPSGEDFSPTRTLVALRVSFDETDAATIRRAIEKNRGGMSGDEKKAAEGILDLCRDYLDGILTDVKKEAKDEGST